MYACVCVASMQGRVVSFKNTIIILTSNLGSSAVDTSSSGTAPLPVALTVVPAASPSGS